MLIGLFASLEPNSNRKQHFDFHMWLEIAVFIFFIV